jgi:hypothetical protein
VNMSIRPSKGTKPGQMMSKAICLIVESSFACCRQEHNFTQLHTGVHLYFSVATHIL